MKVGIVGDTHLPRFGDRLPAAVREGLRDEGVELILHLGDFTGLEVPALFEALAPLEPVAGNNDPPALVARFGRRKILEQAGARVDVVCFGHSHQPLCERRDPLWIVNPGSPTDKRRQPRYSYAILEIARGRAAPRLVFFDRR